jgi:dTDP-4-amino-4,6-dideoxygalactose transaminase
MISENTPEESEQAGQPREGLGPTALSPWPHYEKDEIEAAVSVLESGDVNYWTGQQCRSFEKEFAAYHGVKHGVALANGTLALELAMRVLGLGTGDEVIVTPRSYFASASSIVLAGAKPVFVDIDPDSQNITADQIAGAIGSRTRAILAVHLAGWPCDMPAIMSLARNHELKVIEDCAQSHGAAIDDQPLGSFGDVAAFSFCQDKIMSTAGEGGMLITNDSEISSAAWSFKDHGKSWERVSAKDHPRGFRWLHTGFGSNYRMTEIQGAIGRIQLAKLDGWVLKRQEHANRLAAGLRDLPALRVPMPSERERHSYYKFYAFVRPEQLKKGWTRDRILAALDEEGIPGLSGACPEIYQEEAFEHWGYQTLPVARALGETSLMFQVHPTLSAVHLDRTISLVRKVIDRASA